VNRKPVILATAAIVITVTAFVGTQSKDDPLDAIRAAPDTHKLAFENAFVRVLDVRVPPGSIEKRHRHPHGLSVYFTDWDVKVTVAPPRCTSESRARSPGTTRSRTRSRTSARLKGTCCGSSSNTEWGSDLVFQQTSRAFARVRVSDRRHLRFGGPCAAALVGGGSHQGRGRVEHDDDDAPADDVERK
jgi:hypothetical protein